MGAVAGGPRGADAAVAEFDRQVERLTRLGYPVEDMAPLRGRVPASGTFVMVVRPAAELPFTTMDDLERFTPIDGVDVPPGPAYLVTDVDTGRATLNVTLDDALERIVAEGRSPLTIEEGLAVLAQDPGILRTQNAFSLLGSRCGDRRVPALWVSAGRPRLGWCWAGNPHTWLGSASCARRIGAD
jgi:Family of unknown function (DUF5701)